MMYNTVQDNYRVVGLDMPRTNASSLEIEALVAAAPLPERLSSDASEYETTTGLEYQVQRASILKVLQSFLLH